MMAFVFPPEMSRRARAAAGEPDAAGWLVTEVPIESIRHGHTELLRLGAERRGAGDRLSCGNGSPRRYAG